MTFTYTGDLTVPLEYVRFKIGDKEEDIAIFQDEEINFFINQISGTPSTSDLNKVSLNLLNQILQDILRGPSRERSGAYEVYAASPESLKLAISQLEKEVRSASAPTPSFGGVYKTEVKQNRKNPAFVRNKFYDDRVYRDVETRDDDFIKDC